MENILNKNIFNDRDLIKLAPDFAPQDVMLRMQLRQTFAKDTHRHRIFKNTVWIRKSFKKSKDTYNINKEIIKLRHEFNNINLKTRLKILDTIKFKSKFYDQKLSIANSMNEIDTNIVLSDFADDRVLEISNDNDFKLSTKSKSIKQRFNKHGLNKETPRDKRFKRAKGDLMDLNKDINENNEDMFKVVVHKRPKPEELKMSKSEEYTIANRKDCNSPSDYDKPMADLQNLLVMMTLASKPDEHYDEVELNNIETCKEGLNPDHNNDNDDFVSNNAIKQEGIDNILSITPIRLQMNNREKYLIDKYIYKWKNFVKRRKRYIDEERQATLNKFFDKIAKKKMDINQPDHHESKAKHLLRDFNTYQHRYRIQKHIIALQKVKLEEQNRIIEELKYNKIVEASRQSIDGIKEEVRRAYYELDRQLKPKLKCLTKELKIADIEEPSLVLHCLKVPQFLQRMEKRAREREEKHAIIRERRRQMEEERIRLKQQAELAKAEMDKEEKMRRLKDLKEKRKKEKIETIRKKQWCERLRALIVMADLHYEKSLKSKYGIAPLRRLLAIKQDNIEKAREHYNFQLKNNVFLHWMWYTEDMCFERNYKAEDFYRKKLLHKVFNGFKIIHYNVILRKQVADDYYDLYLTQMAFRMFCKGIKVIRKENEAKWQKAVAYHRSNLLFKVFICWRTLPALNALRREQEARKARWREKVLQVVPDYTPPDY